ncbi:MAG TPA: Tad domain-containing protein [Anaerolineales bacterium]|nr:Tad domain-containing protein [Anaerolineales bacterium]
MFSKAPEKGQALILIALAAVGLFAFAALAIDGSRVYSEKRHAQNAADTAALAAALSYTRNNSATIPELQQIAQDRATSNGFDNLEKSDITIAVESTVCPGGAAGKNITVTIIAYVDTSFTRVIGRDRVKTAVTATSRACGYYLAPLFGGYPIVGLGRYNDPKMKNCAFDSGQSKAAEWKVKGGGIFSNGCAHSKDSDSVTFVDPGTCVTSVGAASGFGCTVQQNQTLLEINYPTDVLKIMPPNPCDGTPGDIGLPPPTSGSTFTNGVYCISHFDDYDKKDIVLDNATLYVTDTNFSLKFAGTGGFYGTPTESGGYTGSKPYEDYYMIIAMSDPPCEDFTKGDQTIEWRGNGSGSFYGTILAPSACLDLRGNGDTDGMHTQIIAYTVSSNGNAGAKNQVYINYEADENHQDPVFPFISQLR